LKKMNRFNCETLSDCRRGQEKDEQLQLMGPINRSALRSLVTYREAYFNISI